MYLDVVQQRDDSTQNVYSAYAVLKMLRIKKWELMIIVTVPLLRSYNFIVLQESYNLNLKTLIHCVCSCFPK